MKTYKSSGVNNNAGNEFVEKLKLKARSTFSKSVLSEIGLFGGFYDGKFENYQNPVLVSSVDGVGTKLKIAFLMNKHNTVGQDLVNHCVNDIAVSGAEPLFFLDYFAAGRLSPKVSDEIMDGIITACKENNCSLIGGETLEMPGIYHAEEYDLAGTIIGVVEKSEIFDGKKIKIADILIALPSNGLHTNGYSLARSVLLERYEWDDFIDSLGMRLGDCLLEIHKSYYPSIKIIKKFPTVHGIAHITGGGIYGNVKRLLKKNFDVNIDWFCWERPPIFNLIQRDGEVPESEMRSTFNLGIGLIIICAKRGHEEILDTLKKTGEKPFIIGHVVEAKNELNINR